jgi:hypothetical protein
VGWHRCQIRAAADVARQQLAARSLQGGGDVVEVRASAFARRELVALRRPGDGVEAVVEPAAAHRHVAPFLEERVGTQDESPVHGHALSDMPGDGVAVRQAVATAGL